ncbi:Concanavalin A-like lectin/glucanase domain [Phytophthora cactorum]|nr:Concanavalin A-like lectin/glucanase domain [Phytophthora cactorum]
MTPTTTWSARRLDRVRLEGRVVRRRLGQTEQTIKTLSVEASDLLRNENALEQVASVSVNGSAQVLNSTGASFELIAEVPEFERGSKSSTADCAVFADNDVKPISDSVWGHFYLYDLFSGAAQNDVCEATREKLSFHVFVDVSSVEVFVNGRFSLSARVYPCASQTKSDGIA